MLIARFGALSALVTGLVLCAIGSALRGIGPSIAMLYIMTVIMAFGVAVMQPALAPLVRAWVPSRIGFATAVYTNGLIVGEILPAAFTIPVLLPALDQSWQWTFVAWAIPVAAIAAIIVAFAPRTPATGAIAPAASRLWRPDFRNPLLWRIGLLLGSVNSVYFALNGFLPDYLTHAGRPDLINGALTALNLGQLPASLLLLASADRMVRTVWSYVVCGLVCFVSVLAIVFLGGVWVIAGAALIGCFSAAILVLILALPPMISAPEDVHRFTAGIFTISYSCAVVVPIISGGLWDLTGSPAIAFVPIVLCTLAVVGLAPTIVLRENSAVVGGPDHGRFRSGR
jgi:CP family cyanate transporter-like MFS transporter